MDDIQRKKLENAFGPLFVDAIEVLKEVYLTDIKPMLEPPPVAPEDDPFVRMQRYQRPTPLIDENGVEVTIRIRRDSEGHYHCTGSEGYSVEQVLGPLHVSSRAMNVNEAICRLAPRLGEAIHTAECKHEMEQLRAQGRDEE